MLLLTYQANQLTQKRPLSESGAKLRQVRPDQVADSNVKRAVYAFQENLFKNSSDFSAGDWTTTGTMTPTTGIIDPLGGTTATRFNVTTGSISQAVSTIKPTRRLTISGWAKKAPSSSASKLIVTTQDGLTWGTGKSVAIDLGDRWTRFSISTSMFDPPSDYWHGSATAYRVFFGALTDSSANNFLTSPTNDFETWIVFRVIRKIFADQGVNGSITTTMTLIPDTQTGNHSVETNYVTTTPQLISFYAKSSGYTVIGVSSNVGGVNWVHFTLSGSGTVSTLGTGITAATITSVANGWYYITVTPSTVWVNLSLYPQNGTMPASGNTAPLTTAGNGTSGVTVCNVRITALSATVDSTAVGNMDLWGLQLNYGDRLAETTATTSSQVIKDSNLDYNAGRAFNLSRNGGTAGIHYINEQNSNYTYAGSARTVAVLGANGFCGPVWGWSYRDSTFNNRLSYADTISGANVGQYGTNNAQSLQTSGGKNGWAYMRLRAIAASNDEGTQFTVSGVTVSTQYTFSCYVRSAVSSIASTNGTSATITTSDAAIRIAAGLSAAAQQTTLVKGSLTTAWQRISVTFTAAATSGTMQIFIPSTSGSAIGAGFDYCMPMLNTGASALTYDSGHEYGGSYILSLNPTGWSITRVSHDASFSAENDTIVDSGVSPTAALGTWYDFEIQHNGPVSVVKVNGSTISTLTDTGTGSLASKIWYAGTIGMFSYNATAELGPVFGLVNDNYSSYSLGSKTLGAQLSNWYVENNVGSTVSIVDNVPANSRTVVPADVEGTPVYLSSSNKINVIDPGTETAQGVSYPLSYTASTPLGLWSTRKLNPQYEGPALTVMRLADNAVKDIYFLPNGDINVYDLVSHVGAQNLTWNSENFSALWNNQASPIVRAAIDVLAPDGRQTAYYLERTTTASNYIYQVIGVASGDWTGGIFVKAANCRYFALRLQGSFPERVDVNFDLLTGTIATAATAFSGATNPGATITHVGNGWYRCTISCTLTTTAGSLSFSPTDGGNKDADDTTSSIGQSVYIWGASSNQGLTALDYCKTLAADGVTSNGTVHRLYDQSDNSRSANLLLNTANPTTTTGWTFSDVTSASSAIVQPPTELGGSGSTVLKYSETTSAGVTHFLQQTLNTVDSVDACYTNGFFTYSWYVKPAERNVVRLRVRDSTTALIADADYDLIRGVYSMSVGLVANMVLEDTVNNWWRISITYKRAIAINGPDNFYLTILDAWGNSAGTYTGATSNGIYLFGAHVTPGQRLLPFYPTTTTAKNTRDLYNYNFDQQPKIVNNGVAVRLNGKVAYFTDGTTNTTNRYLQTFAFTDTQPLTRISTIKLQTVGAASPPTYLNTASSNEISLSATTTGMRMFTTGSSTPTMLTSAISAGNTYTFVEIFNTTTSVGLANGTSTNNSLASVSGTGLVIGYDGGAGTKYASGYYTDIMMFSGAMSSTDYGKLMRDSRDYWNFAGYTIGWTT